MNDGDMHETIRGFYQGVLEPHAWQRSLQALCELSGSVQASLLVRDADQQSVRVRQTVHRSALGLSMLPAAYATQDGLPYAGTLPVGGWHIERRAGTDPAGGDVTVADSRPRDASPFDDAALASVMACLVDRRPSQEIFLTLRRPADRASFSEDDARALDWAIPHLREAMTLRDRTHSVATHGRVSSDLLNRLPFGVIVFAESGKVLLANAGGEPWVRRLLPSSTGDGAESTPANAQGWRLARPFADLMRSLRDGGALQPAQAVQAIGADGRVAQIVAVALSPAQYLSSEWQGQPVLVAIHENPGTSRAVPAVLRDLYGLTPAENRLAMLLTTGIGLPDACAQLGIKRETSRSQLKSIFTKTNTSTQAQLAHLLTRLASVLADPADTAESAEAPRAAGLA